jgi:hypothetical protein
MKDELKNIKHAITLLQKAVAQLEGRLPVETPKKQNGFRPPTGYEAESHHIQKEYKFSFWEWWNHYTSNGWKVGKNPMKDWTACMAQWEARHKKKEPVRETEQLDAHGRPIKDNGTGRLL